MEIQLRNGECKHIKIHHYPDGQKNVTLDMDYFNNVKEAISIKCNIRDFSELEILLCIVKALEKNDFFIDEIEFVYLFGMRSDRAFEKGMPNYFRDVLAPIINSLPCETVRIMSPHSELSLNALVNTRVFNRRPDIYGSIPIGADASFSRWDGARYFEYFFDKKRNGDKIEVHLSGEFYSVIEKAPDHLPIMIMDDLCDGGGTFIAIADYLKEHFSDRKRFLYVAHGLFTKGIPHVLPHYDKIITTNSYQDFKDEFHPNLEILDVWDN